MRKLAVLMPSYNAAAYLKESIDSILNQSFGEFDLYIFDDCSTDHTKEIISQYDDSRVFYRENTANSGIAKTLNRGLKELLPHYEYIARMDADDWCHPTRFEKQFHFMSQNQEIIMCGMQGYWLKNINQNPITGWEYPLKNEYIKLYLLFSASFGHSSVIFRSDSFHNHQLRYDESIETCEDWDLWVKVSKIGMVANLPDFLMKYRILENSNHRSSRKIKKHLEERSKIISGYWANFNIILSTEEVYEYYYGTKILSMSNFINKIKILIDVFNRLFLREINMEPDDRKNFSYMLARKILSYWKRSSVNRLNPLIWIIIVKEVKFMNKIKLIKSLIR